MLKLFMNLIRWGGINGLEELLRICAESVFRGPSVQFLSATIPIGDEAGGIPDEDGVMGEVEQAGLLSALGHFDLEMIACLAQVPLNAAPNSAEPSNQEGNATKTTK